MQKSIFRLIILSFLCIQTSVFVQNAEVFLYGVDLNEPVSLASPTSMTVTVEEFTSGGLSTLDFILYVDGVIADSSRDVDVYSLPTDEF